MNPGPLVVVTGATDGIGKQTAIDLARRGARVIVHGRNPARVGLSRSEVESASGAAMPEPIVADLARLADVRAMASAIAARGEPIDVLVNNAGIFAKEERRTVDGFESTFAVNHLAPFLLTHLLLPRLAPGARVVNVSSIAHTRGTLSLDDLEGRAARYSGYAAYATSKQANVLFTAELARRLGDPSRVAVNALHPGVVSTKVLREGFGVEGPDSLEEGARTSVLVAMDPAFAVFSGRYFVRAKLARPSPACEDLALARAFYEHSASLVGVEPLPDPHRR